MEKEKRNIHELIEKESPNLNNILDSEDVSDFKGMMNELRDTWTKKQVFRTETEMKFSVLNDLKYPTKASKYWQCVREQNVYLESLMAMSFGARRNALKMKRLEEKIDTETNEYKKELMKIDLDELRYGLASEQLVAKDRMREIRLWSKFKKEFDDGTFNTEDVNAHQMESYHMIMLNRRDTLTKASTQPEVFNVMGQLSTLERLKNQKALEEPKKIQLPKGLGAEEEK